MDPRLNVTATGPAGGTPLVLLHGFPLDSRIWADTVPLLPGRVVLVDLPGFGKSTGAVATSMEGFSQSLHECLKSLDLLPCVLGGLSMGGYVAQDFLGQYRADVRGLILIDTKSGADDETGRAGRDAMIRSVRAGGAAAVSDQMLPRVLGPTSHRIRPEVVRRASEIMRSQSPAGIEAALTAMRDRPDYTTALDRIDVPTLIVVGEEDDIAPASIATGMGARITGSKVVAIGGAGHFTPIEAPGAFGAVVRDWLASGGFS